MWIRDMFTLSRKNQAVFCQLLFLNLIQKQAHYSLKCICQGIQKNTILFGELRPWCCDTLKSSCLDLSTGRKQELTRILMKKFIQVGKETGGTQENQGTMDAQVTLETEDNQKTQGTQGIEETIELRKLREARYIENSGNQGTPGTH